MTFPQQPSIAAETAILIRLTEEQQNLVQNALATQIVETKSYLASYRADRAPEPTDTCCPTHLARFEEHTAQFEALTARTQHLERLTQLVEEAEPDSMPDFSADGVNTAFNRAADEVLDVADDGCDERLRDTVNLVVNAGLHFLEHPDASLEDAVRENYDDDFAENLLDALR